MSNKIGRNDPCWCGSGKLYKHCHFKRDQLKSVSKQEVSDAVRKGFSKRECLHPEAPTNCDSKIIQAHTIQRNGGLSKIAKNGHVYTPFFDTPLFGKPVSMRSQGIRVASTFAGFCKYHDKLLFAPIEDHPIEINEHHALLLAVRAVSRELYARRRTVALIPFGKSLDRGKDLQAQLRVQQHFSHYQIGAESSLRDYEYHKNLMDKAILSADCKEVFYYAIKLDKTPDVLCSGAIFPYFDFHGNQVQDLWQTIVTTRPADCLTFSLLATSGGGIALFSWIGDCAGNRKFIKSLHSLADNEVPHAILRLIFEYFENMYVAPNWWEYLPNEIQNKLMNRYRKSLESADLPTSACLKDDGLRAVSWTVVSRETNLVLA